MKLFFRKYWLRHLYNGKTKERKNHLYCVKNNEKIMFEKPQEFYHIA
jgi:hypothetical protein